MVNEVRDANREFKMILVSFFIYGESRKGSFLSIYFIFR